MSPIGRVFIVLNLILAGTFVGFSGTHLQKQFHWKRQAEKVQGELDSARKEMSSEIERLRSDLSTMTTAKSTGETQLSQTRNDLDNAKDEVKRLETSNASMDADLKKLASEIGGIKSNADAAFTQARDAYQASLAAAKEKDEAVRSKDTATAENRDLKNQVAALTETVSQKDLLLADASAEKSRLNLLVDVAKAKGFLEGMAVPALAGTVSSVSGNLCTILVDKSDEEIKPGYSFAIYDTNGYKGEAKVTSVDAERRAAFCRLEIKSGEIKTGDKASTHLAGY
jgi:myosin heavy subunit